MSNQNMKASVLIALTFTMWEANILDKQASVEVADSNNVSEKAMCRVRKSLVPANTALARISELHNAARKFLYENTHAWKFKGPRILTIANYEAVVSKLREYEAEVNIAIPEFLSQYDDIREDAKEKLGDLFKESDYPSVVDLKSKFAFAISVDAIPVSSDLLELGFSAKEAEIIEEANNKSLISVLDRANTELWGQLHQRLSALFEQIATPKSKVRAKTLERVIETVALIPKINITGDERLDAICNNVSEILVLESKESIDNNESKKEAIALKLKNMIKLIEVVTTKEVSAEEDLESSSDQLLNVA